MIRLQNTLQIVKKLLKSGLKTIFVINLNYNFNTEQLNTGYQIFDENI